MFLCQVGPQSTNEILVLPVLLCLFGAFSWWMGVRALKRGGKGWGRVPGGLLIGFAIFHGIRLLWSLYQPGLSDFYRATLSRKMLYAHYVAFLMPLLVIALLYGARVVRQRQSLDHE